MPLTHGLELAVASVSPFLTNSAVVWRSPLCSCKLSSRPCLSFAVAGIAARLSGPRGRNPHLMCFDDHFILIKSAVQDEVQPKQPAANSRYFSVKGANHPANFVRHQTSASGLTKSCLQRERPCQLTKPSLYCVCHPLHLPGVLDPSVVLTMPVSLFNAA